MGGEVQCPTCLGQGWEFCPYCRGNKWYPLAVDSFDGDCVKCQRIWRKERKLTINDSSKRQYSELFVK
ncbi:hypothetical protein CEXT_186771 [Caerostris extrusa]|uniref:Uncharacterized protein n=1 Tax=Caerostris extrusa TaxID=172846 RepID=A0AAV4NLZ2_CAEEX|nr:hypothetical protein CEXT_186771 [Caerostris extrusa]